VLAAGLVTASVVQQVGGSNGEEPSVTAPVSDLGGIPQEGTVLGDPKATVTMIEYADLACPFCAQYSTDVFPALVDRYVRPGTLKMEFRGLAFLQPVENSERALRYSLAAGEQSRLWDYVERVYANQGEEGTEWFTESFGRAVAEQIPGLDVDRLVREAGSDNVMSEMAESADQGQASNVSGTPTFFLKIGSNPPDPIVVQELTPEAFSEAIDDALGP
jgi:protein-disulfide isomerase